jgi:predicted small lipoprotein YifL
MKTLFFALLVVGAAGCGRKNPTYPPSPTAPTGPIQMDQNANLRLNDEPDAGMPEPPAPPNDGPLPPM